ncbi:unnamed protein product [Polarella glacialis]|uniref:Uncharacterized protein n=2 Tax=Polarella glacialis TaxID=89957 RepID=A0A813J7D8_POLGL|nr:unnamed protein product [Polarella glacialis]
MLTSQIIAECHRRWWLPQEHKATESVQLVLHFAILGISPAATSVCGLFFFAQGSTNSERIMERWASMPFIPRKRASDRMSFSTQLPEEILHATRLCTASSQGFEDREVSGSTRPPSQQFRTSRRSSRRGTPPSTVSSCRHWDGKEFPFVACDCCERASPMPRIEYQALGPMAAALVAADKPLVYVSRSPLPASTWPPPIAADTA